jgi:hypothetical protein
VRMATTSGVQERTCSRAVQRCQVLGPTLADHTKMRQQTTLGRQMSCCHFAVRVDEDGRA